MYYDIIIIGGGASGLCTAIKAKKDNNSVLVIEHSGKVGKKILSTGNGKCNLTNEFCKVSLFDKNPEGILPYNTSGDFQFIKDVIYEYDSDDTIAFFESLGVLTENKNGYIYPRSEQASTINDALKLACARQGVKIVTEYNVTNIKNSTGKNQGKDYRFIIDEVYCCNYLVLACGGKSSQKTGSDGSGYNLAESLGHHVIKPRPALCAVKCNEKFFKELAGVRNDSRLTLYDGNKKAVLVTQGNLQFTDYGISGIPVFQMSNAVGKLLDSGEKISIKIDLLPEKTTESELAIFIDSKNVYSSENDRLYGVLNKKLANVINKEIKHNGRHVGETYGIRTAPLIKRFKVTPSQLVGFDNAQITAGGVSTNEINPGTMESKLIPGLYFVGEIIDVDGICGGYNLQWAWSTAFVAGQTLSDK